MIYDIVFERKKKLFGPFYFVCFNSESKSAKMRKKENALGKTADANAIIHWPSLAVVLMDYEHENEKSSFELQGDTGVNG